MTKELLSPETTQNLILAKKTFVILYPHSLLWVCTKQNKTPKLMILKISIYLPSAFSERSILLNAYLYFLT